MNLVGERMSLNDATPEEWDAVRNPKHYNQSSIETIEMIYDRLSPEEYRGYLWGNILKYAHRWPAKGGPEDLRKMVWYALELAKSEEEK
jgi:hypothetical protein